MQKPAHPRSGKNTSSVALYSSKNAIRSLPPTFDAANSKSANGRCRTSSAAQAAASSTSARALRDIPQNNQTAAPRRKSQQLTSRRPSVPLTDPQRTAQLWQRVRMASRHMKPTKASQQKAKSNDDSAAMPTQSSLETTTTQQARMQDSNFRKAVLTPRGISFPLQILETGPFVHFDTSQPPHGMYRDLAGCQYTDVWLNAEELITDVKREYTYMKYENLCEGEFATYAKEALLRRDPRFLEQKEDRGWRTERMVEMFVKVGLTDDSDPWLGPPVLSQACPSKRYDFNIRPDCQYWLSMNSFNQTYTQSFDMHVFVHRHRILCPYFTIEFKKDEATIIKAENQVATAAMIALYNRCRLKQKRLIRTRKRWAQKHNTSLRHYALTLTGTRYQFWLVRLREDATGNQESVSAEKWRWTGCDMVRAWRGHLDRTEHIRKFVDCVNEIHRWGLSVHGPSCERDLKFCITHSESGVRTSLGSPEEAAQMNSDSEVDDEA